MVALSGFQSLFDQVLWQKTRVLKGERLWIWVVKIEKEISRKKPTYSLSNGRHLTTQLGLFSLCLSKPNQLPFDVIESLQIESARSMQNEGVVHYERNQQEHVIEHLGQVAACEAQFARQTNADGNAPEILSAYGAA